MTAPADTTRAPELPPLRSVHTSSFAPLLEHLGVSLLVSTYQAGKLVILRADGGVLNTHFRNFAKPMGLACEGERLTIGTAMEVWEFHNVSAVARKLEPAGKHDACFLPRAAHVTGDIQIHEMAWVTPHPRPLSPEGRGEHQAFVSPTGRGEQRASLAPAGRGENLTPLAPAAGERGGGEGEPELVFVNTRFSCLARRARPYSFVPCWRPAFISALAPEDRCHLNGLGVRDGQVRYVTALGATDTPGGWRANKRSGGILLEVPSGAVLAGGLSMPHSPRWYADELWLLESGNGGVGVVDEATGRYESIAELPGFTRGFDFHDRFAFIGLSQVRESALFSGIAIAERPERSCGVWVLDIVSGQTLAYLKFEEAVQEIFAVAVLPGRRFPEVLNDDPTRIANSFVLPDQAFAEVAEPLRNPAASAAPRTQTAPT